MRHRVGAVICGVVLMVVGLALPATGANEVLKGYVVVLQPGANTQALSDAHSRKLGITVERVYRSALRGYAGRMTPAAARAVRSLPGVVSVEPNVQVFALAQDTPNGLDRIASPDIEGDLGSGSTIDGNDERVDADIAVIDTGSGPHPDLNVVMRADCTISSACSDGVGADANGHGTHVAGIAAALDNGIGVVGTAPGARIWSVRVLGAGGTGQLSWVISGIDWVTKHSDTIDVANLSVGCRCVSAALDAALTRSKATGVSYVVAAGNDAADASNFAISGHPGVITTSALADFDGRSGGLAQPTCRTDVDDTLAGFSNFGSAVDLVAPGVCIRSTWLGGGYEVLSGTSMAAPYVAGAAALLASQPAYQGDAESIRTALLTRANFGWTDDSGDGIQEPLLDITDVTPETLTAAIPVALRVEDAWLQEGGSAKVRVSLNRDLQGGEVVKASIESADGTAKAGYDYASLAGSAIRLVAGQSEATVDVASLADDVPESQEAFNVIASKVVGAVVADPAATVSLYDSGGPLGVSVGDVSLPEDAGTASVTVSLDAPVPVGHKVTLAAKTANSSAVAGADYTAIPAQSLTFGAGEQSRTLATTVVDDDLHEGNESFAVTLSAATGARIVDGAGSVTVLDNEGPIGLSVTDAWIAEGQTGSSSATFSLSLSTPPASGQVVTAAVKTTGSSASAGSDFTALSTTLTFSAGERTKAVQVPVSGDSVAEPNESFRLTISTATGAVIVDSVGVGTIANDDGVEPGVAPRWLSVEDEWLTEAPGGRAGQVVLHLSTPPSPGETVQVTVSSATGSATAGSDFAQLPPTTITFEAGQTEQGVATWAMDDSVAELTESFPVNLTAAVGATIVDAVAKVSVMSDEGPLAAMVNDPWVLEGDAGQHTVVAAVRLSEPPANGQSVSVKVSTAPSSASAQTDYANLPSTTLTFAPGDILRSVSLTINGDLRPEGTEALLVNLSSPAGLSIADAQGTVTLVDEEGPISASLLDTEVWEGNLDTAVGALTVRLSQPPQAGQALAVKLGTTTGGTATASVDYLAQSLTVVTFATGEESKTLPITVFGDAVGEVHETIQLTAVSPTGGLTIADGSASLTILNDD